MKDLNRCIKVLGEPYFQTKHFLLYNMDSLKAMKKLRKSKVRFNLTVTSPPYNIGKEYEIVTDQSKYCDWTELWIKRVHDLTTDDGAFLLNVGYTKLKGRARAIPIPYLIWDSSPFFLNQEIIWYYKAGVSCKKYLSPRNEKIMWYVKDKDNYTFNLDEIRIPSLYKDKRFNSLGKNPTDVWDIPKVTSGCGKTDERTKHPAQTPLDVVERIVKGFSNKRDLVLEPFLGSGTMAEACIRNKRYVIGFELKRDYCRMAKKRIKNVLRKRKIKRKFHKTKRRKLQK